MSLLNQKTILLTGIASNRSIAYHIGQACVREGAQLIVTYPNERMQARVDKLCNDWPVVASLHCDVADDASLQKLHDDLSTKNIKLDGLVHAIAYAERSQIHGDFIAELQRNHFLDAMNISAYSLPAMCQALSPLFNPKASIMTLSFIGAHLATPNYNVMGVAKAALESSMRYAARDFGKQDIRVNAISAGPIKTLAASGIHGFKEMLQRDADITPLPGNTQPEEVANHSAFLLSDLSQGMTGQVLYVDHGYHFSAAT
ncbi:MAG: enoyl-ACP reductase FabI [Candidatus Comchoanobacterales bacterium]